MSLDFADVTSLLAKRDGETYDSFARVGVILVVSAGSLSLLSVITMFVFVVRRHKVYAKICRLNLLGYFASLLVANLVQSIGTVLSIRWIVMGQAESGKYCFVQGALKQVGNVGTAIWALIISAHLFNILFLRWPATRGGFIATIVLGWTAVVGAVTFVPMFMAKKSPAPFFDVSVYWCQISHEYAMEQTILESVLELLSAGIGLITYALIMLKVRGNLVFTGGKLGIRWILRCTDWKLCAGRDPLDCSMLRVAPHMIWYPLTYMIIIIPKILVECRGLSMVKAPTWAVIDANVFFALNGCINVILLFTTDRLLPQPCDVPPLSKPASKKGSEKDAMDSDISPFLLTRSNSPVSQLSRPQRAAIMRQEYRRTFMRFLHPSQAPILLVTQH